MKKIVILLAMALCMITIACSGGGDSDDNGPQEPVYDATGVWVIHHNGNHTEYCTWPEEVRYVCYEMGIAMADGVYDFQVSIQQYGNNFDVYDGYDTYSGEIDGIVYTFSFSDVYSDPDITVWTDTIFTATMNNQDDFTFNEEYTFTVDGVSGSCMVTLYGIGYRAPAVSSSQEYGTRSFDIPPNSFHSTSNDAIQILKDNK